MTPDEYIPVEIDDSDFVLPKDKREIQEITIHEYQPSVSVEDDFNTIKQNINSIMNVCKNAIEESVALAKENEGAKSWDTVNELLKTMLQTNQSLFDLHEKKAKILKTQGISSPEKPKTIPTNATQNNYYYMSPMDLAATSEEELKKND